MFKIICLILGLGATAGLVLMTSPLIIGKNNFQNILVGCYYICIELINLTVLLNKFPGCSNRWKSEGLAIFLFEGFLDIFGERLSIY